LYPNIYDYGVGRLDDNWKKTTRFWLGNEARDDGREAGCVGKSDVPIKGRLIGLCSDGGLYCGAICY
jgi:hypothetical protein